MHWTLKGKFERGKFDEDRLGVRGSYFLKGVEVGLLIAGADLLKIMLDITYHCDIIGKVYNFLLN